MTAFPTGQLKHAEVVPWEAEDGQFGIAYAMDNGRQGTVQVGTKEQADAALREILAEHQPPASDAENGVPLFPKDIAAS